jgi:hypothetical protein
MDQTDPSLHELHPLFQKYLSHLRGLGLVDL